MVFIVYYNEFDIENQHCVCKKDPTVIDFEKWRIYYGNPNPNADF